MKQEETFFSEGSLSGIPWVIISKSLLFLVYFIISVLTVRYLGADNYGIYVICKSIAEVLILVCTLGMTASFMRFIPELMLQKNKAGIKRLVLRASCIQLSALALVFTLLFYSTEWLEAYLAISLNGVLFFTCVLVTLELFKTNINAILTAIYQLKTLALFSSFHGLFWLVLLFTLMQLEPSVAHALSAPTISYALIYFIAAICLFQYFKALNWRSPDKAIGRKRVLNHSGSVALSTFIRLLMLKYTELFFLAGQHDAATVGAYDLAYTLPLMVIIFIPAAIQDLFVAGFSEAYVKNNQCLPALIRAFYKLIILLTVPLAVFGFFFSADFLNYTYGGEVSGVSELISLFCLLHLLPLISVPLSMAIQAKEKVISTLPTLALQLCVNIFLDYLFIVQWQWGVWGAISAVFFTFLLTIPVRLYVVKQILGGIYFPCAFFIRIAGLCFSIGFAFKTCLASPSLAVLLLLAPAYFLVFLLMLKPCSVLSTQDKYDLAQLARGKPQRLLDKLKNLSPFDFKKAHLTNSLGE